MAAGNGTVFVSEVSEGLTARIALGGSMTAFGLIATFGNVLFWFALIYDKRVRTCN